MSLHLERIRHEGMVVNVVAVAEGGRGFLHLRLGHYDGSRVRMLLGRHGTDRLVCFQQELDLVPLKDNAQFIINYNYTTLKPMIII